MSRPALLSITAMIILLVISAPPGLASPSGPPHVERAAPPLGTPRIPASYPTLFWGNTTILTSDPQVANNSGLNFTFNMPTGSMAQYQNLTMVEEEALNSTLSVEFGAIAIDNNGPTLVTPFVLLPNGTWVAGTASLPTQNADGVGMVHVAGGWWSFDADGVPLVGAATWENGTYWLGVARAQGIAKLDGEWVDGPTLTLREGAPFLPISLFLDLPTVFQVLNGSTPYRPDNGELHDAQVASYTVPVSGHNQSSAIPNDTIISPGTSPTTQNGVPLWGNLPQPTVLAGLLGAYTNDSAFADNDTTGAALTYQIPGTVPSGEAVLAQLILPINESTVFEIGFASFDYYSLGFTIPEAGLFQNFGSSSTIFIDLTQREDPGDNDTVVLQHLHGPWWNLTANGAPFVAAGGAGGGSPTNGTFDLGTATALGVSHRPFQGNDSFATDPTLYFSGNLTPTRQNASYELQANGGAWVAPAWGIAWSLGNTSDVEYGHDQAPSIPVGTVRIENATSTIPKPLSNGTLLWSPAPSVSAIIVPPTAMGSENLTVSAWVNWSGSPVASAAVQGVAEDGGTFTPFAWSAASGAFVSTFQTPSVAGPIADPLLIFAVVPWSPVPGTALLSLPVAPPGHLSVSGVFSTGGTTLLSPPGQTVRLDLYVNATPTSGLANVSLSLASSLAGGSFGPPNEPALGEYQVEFIPPDVVGTDNLTAVVRAPGYLAAALPPLVLTMPPPLVPGALGVNDAGSFLVGSGGVMEFFLNVTSGGQPFPGATVQFSFSPTLTAAAPAPVTTNAAGEATFQLQVPPAGSSGGSYQLSAGVTAAGHAPVSPAPLTFTISAPSSPTPSGNSTTTLDLLLALIGIMIAGIVLLLFLPSRGRSQGSRQPKRAGAQGSEEGDWRSESAEGQAPPSAAPEKEVTPPVQEEGDPSPREPEVDPGTPSESGT